MKLAKTRLSDKERLTLLGDLHTMLTAGIPILDAIESLEADAKGNQQKILEELHRALINGETLSKSMARFPKAFDDITVNLLGAAEAGGTLEETLQDMVKTAKKEVAFSTTIKSAMVYPAFVMLVFTVILLLLLTFVIPRITHVFITMNIEIPWATRQLMYASDFFLDYWMWVLAGATGVIMLLVTLIKKYKRTFARWTLSLPILRRLGTNIDLARLTRSLSMLLKAGVPLEEALILTKRVVQKKQIITVIGQMQTSIAAGKPLASGLRNTKGVVPVMMVRSMETAETSGTLEQTLQGLSEHFDTQVTNRLKSISSILEPIMILIVGGMVGLLMITVIAPMYNMISQFRNAAGR